MKGIIGTAGHIDHGKTALIGALTGEQTDRLPEEQRRGISIDLGFSHMDVEAGRLGIVDVPGHEDFIRNMLAGATGIDILLLVVAADEGVMPQTREHTAIATLLGVDRAVVALTKRDLVGDDWLGLVHDDLADFLADTPFAGAPVVPTSTLTGDGIDELKAEIGRVFTRSVRRDDDHFRLPVDRIFTVRGTGTVVTGTVWSGALERDAEVTILPGERQARVRSLQVHGQAVDRIEAGERAAVALTGMDRDDVQRGDTLVAEPGWTESHILTTRLRVLPGSDWWIEPRQRVRVHLGTAEVMARVTILDRDEPLRPGQEGWAQLRLEEPLVPRTGDRLVVRSYSPVTTIGGGRVVEPVAPPRKRLEPGDAAAFEALLRRDSSNDVVTVLLDRAGAGGVALESLPVLAGVPAPEIPAALGGALTLGGRSFGAAAVEKIHRRALDVVASYHADHPLEPGMDPQALRVALDGADEMLIEHVLQTAVDAGELAAARGRLSRSDWAVTLSPEQEAVRAEIVTALRDAGLEPPRIDELTAGIRAGAGMGANVEAILRLMEAEGVVVRIEHDLYADAAAMDGLVEGVKDRFGGKTGLSPADFRQVADVSRRHLMPLLAWLDGEGITVRSGGGRSVPG